MIQGIMAIDVQSISKILYDSWNPIAVTGLPADEYDTYAAHVVEMLSMDPIPWTKIDAYLHRSAVMTMGLSSMPRENATQCVAVLKSYVQTEGM